ncbi:uncharacterized protein J7T55_009932 [Diaporthe amygdali]|uniref:uncharacterized protein n=1 Tax=Phomopsis amygdali TaxID=1214568 RepID=UPI0022FE517B|nr:uncharacterized protein J7T55_009932 [Diaporthe amygdali]KAJ0116781.1 uncharacterized protein J7T55_009932 [Diaporthe amygdali]
MEWLDSTTDFKRKDRRHFKFDPSQSCSILAIKIQQNNHGEIDFQPEKLSTVSEYGAWIDRCRPSSRGQHRPTLLLAMHKRLEGDLTNSTSVAYKEDEFHNFCRSLCQHRTLGSIIVRKSTAVLSSRSVTWTGSDDFGRSTVYHCKSDTESLAQGDDIVLSTTCFTDKPLIFAVMYGCTEDIMEDTELWLDRCKSFAFHPLVLPMIFVEHERKRLFNAIDDRSTELEERILELETRVNKEAKKEVDQQAKKEEARQTMTQRDCEAIQLWRSMSSLKNGLGSLYMELESMRDHLKTLPRSPPKPDRESGSDQETDQGAGMYIDTKLKEMMAEFRSKTRKCEGLLGAMTLATQMEWNYYTRRDAQVNFSIATATKMDSSQMKQISLLGMIFLPGTFLATFFSMTFFSWIPQDSAQIISPWLGLYGGLTLLLTSGTILWFRNWATTEIEDAKENLQQELDRDSDSTLFGSKRSILRSSLSFRSKDVELGEMSP